MACFEAHGYMNPYPDPYPDKKPTQNLWVYPYPCNTLTVGTWTCKPTDMTYSALQHYNVLLYIHTLAHLCNVQVLHDQRPLQTSSHVAFSIFSVILFCFWYLIPYICSSAFLCYFPVCFQVSCYKNHCETWTFNLCQGRPNQTITNTPENAMFLSGEVCLVCLKVCAVCCSGGVWGGAQLWLGEVFGVSWGVFGVSWMWDVGGLSWASGCLGWVVGVL